MLREYKEFLFRGNLLELAVAFILGAAFNAVVQSFSSDIIMESVAGLFGLDNVERLTAGPMLVGRFLAALLSFVIIATVLFLLIKAAARFQRPDDTPAPDPDEVVLLREIRDALRAGR